MLEQRTLERLSAIDGNIKTLTDGMKELEKDVSGIKSSVGTVKWIVGLVGVGLVALFYTFGNAYVRETAREVVREELAFKTALTQKGAFSAATKVSDDPPTFVWKLKSPVDPDKVVSMAVVPGESMPGGISIVATLEDGEACRMELHGSEEAIAEMPDSVPGQMVIGLRD